MLDRITNGIIIETAKQMQEKKVEVVWAFI